MMLRKSATLELNEEERETPGTSLNIPANFVITLGYLPILFGSQ